MLPFEQLASQAPTSRQPDVTDAASSCGEALLQDQQLHTGYKVPLEIPVEWWQPHKN